MLDAPTLPAHDVRVLADLLSTVDDEVRSMLLGNNAGLWHVGGQPQHGHTTSLLAWFSGRGKQAKNMRGVCGGVVACFRPVCRLGGAGNGQFSAFSA